MGKPLWTFPCSPPADPGQSPGLRAQGPHSRPAGLSRHPLAAPHTASAVPRPRRWTRTHLLTFPHPAYWRVGTGPLRVLGRSFSCSGLRGSCLLSAPSALPKCWMGSSCPAPSAWMHLPSWALLAAFYPSVQVGDREPLLPGSLPGCSRQSYLLLPLGPCSSICTSAPSPLKRSCRARKGPSCFHAQHTPACSGRSISLC